MEQNLKDVSIIYVNYFTSRLLKESLESLINHEPNLNYEVIVVDNSNDENELKKLHKLEGIYSNLKVVESKENLGFGKGNNLGSKYATGKYLYFLNTDTLLINDAITQLFNYFENNKDVGALGSNLYDANLKPYHSYRKERKNIAFEKKNGSLIHAFFFKLFRRDDFNYSKKPKKLKGYVCGASLMMLREDFNKLGGFEKDIFMYSEEALLCFKVQEELHKAVYNVPSSKIIHLEGSSFKSDYSFFAKSFIDGNYIYYLKVFNKETANKYLRVFKKKSKKKAFIFKITKKMNQYNKNLALIKYIDEKLEKEK